MWVKYANTFTQNKYRLQRIDHFFQVAMYWDKFTNIFHENNPYFFY